MGSCLVQVLSQVNPEGGQPFGQPLVATLEGEGLDTLFVRRQTTVLALETLQNSEKLDDKLVLISSKIMLSMRLHRKMYVSIKGNLIDRNTNK